MDSTVSSKVSILGLVDKGLRLLRRFRNVGADQVSILGLVDKGLRLAQPDTGLLGLQTFQSLV